MKSALLRTSLYVLLAIAMGLGCYVWRGAKPALEFAAGYTIELALSVDNVAAFVAIFAALATPPAVQRRALALGVWGAVLLRAVFIWCGAALLARFAWVGLLLGAFLLLSGLKLLKAGETSAGAGNWLLRRLRRAYPKLDTPAGAFLLAVAAIETTDLLFAVDSIPAIFGVTRDPWIVLTSNVCAIMGLRALYFVLSAYMARLAGLRLGLALVLAFVGAKMLLEPVYPLSILASFAAIAVLLGAGTWVGGLLHRRRGADAARRAG